MPQVLAYGNCADFCTDPYLGAWLLSAKRVFQHANVEFGSQRSSKLNPLVPLTQDFPIYK